MIRIKRWMCFVLAATLMLGGAMLSPNASGFAQAAELDERMDIAADPAAFRGIPWSSSLEETASFESGRQRTRRVEVTKDVVLYDMQVSKLTYSFADGQMASRQFVFKSNKKAVFSAVFYSICLRYGFPIVAEKSRAVWQNGPLNITLRRGDSLTCTYALDLQAFSEAEP